MHRVHDESHDARKAVHRVQNSLRRADFSAAHALRRVARMDVILPALGAAAAAGFASTAHCAAMCGPLAAAACGGGGGREAAGAAGRYALGRFASYALTGALAGAAGAGLARAVRAERVQQVAALAMGLSLAWVAVRLARAAPSQALVPLRRAKGPRVPALMAGAVTGVLPCGALASALVLAAASGSWWAGALTMLVFALASGPGLVAAVFAGRLLGERATSVAWRRAGAAALLGVAVWVAARPWWMPEARCAHCHTSTVATARPRG